MLLLDIHGLGLQVESEFSSVIDHCAHDFSYFAVEKISTVHFCLRVVGDSRPTDHWRTLVRFRGSTLFHAPPGERRVCFFDRAWVRYDFDQGLCDIYCEDEEVAYETVYLALLSFVGESLDRRGLHRLHGFGFGMESWGGVVLAPSGTGKSTLAMGLLARPGWQILSDDTPLVDRKARMRSFPQRIALKERPTIDENFVRSFVRVKQGQKFVVGSEYFKPRIQAELPVRWLLIAQRQRAGRAGIREVGKWRALWPLFKWLVLGYETPQIWQLYLRFSGREIRSKLRILVSRIRVAVALYRQSRIAVLKLSANVEASCDQFSLFFDRATGDRT